MIGADATAEKITRGSLKAKVDQSLNVDTVVSREGVTCDSRGMVSEEAPLNGGRLLTVGGAGLDELHQGLPVRAPLLSAAGEHAALCGVGPDRAREGGRVERVQARGRGISTGTVRSASRSLTPIQ